MWFYTKKGGILLAFIIALTVAQGVVSDVRLEHMLPEIEEVLKKGKQNIWD